LSDQIPNKITTLQCPPAIKIIVLLALLEESSLLIFAIALLVEAKLGTQAASIMALQLHHPL